MRAWKFAPASGGGRLMRTRGGWLAGIGSPRAGRTAQISALFLAGFAFGCADGMSGPDGTSGPDGARDAPTGGQVLACPCGFVANYARLGKSTLALRVVVNQIEGEEVTLQVEEVISGGRLLEVGEEITANWDGSLPCNRGFADIETGDDAFAFYWPEHAPLQPHGRLALAPWGNPIVFATGSGGEVSVAPDDLLDVLGSGSRTPDSTPLDTCIERVGDAALLGE